MKYLTPDIAKLANDHSKKSLAKVGVSCGIFQDCFDTNHSYENKNPNLKKTNLNAKK
ncbi:hypothetical protein [Flavicella sediminum]|uniref:hypothetical protein n=1 Tax=Flavicella sediminum TaxID=2585141 RepID=UPI00140D6A48|nr:hypothetical protein [Flavicella sediminum]